MNREYHKELSARLGRVMELLVFGHAGMPVLVFPTSSGRFFDFEDHGMIAALEAKIDAGELQLYCVDSVDSESWYNRRVPPRLRVTRHLQFERYILDEVIPAVRASNHHPTLMAMGCSLGGYHAVNLAMRHPNVVSGFLSLSGAFDVTPFLDGYYDQDCYYNLPTHYLPNLTDGWFLQRFQNNTYRLATGWDDQCLDQNQALGAILTAKSIPHQLDVWDSRNSHDWPVWQQMVRQYL